MVELGSRHPRFRVCRRSGPLVVYSTHSIIRYTPCFHRYDCEIDALAMLIIICIRSLLCLAWSSCIRTCRSILRITWQNGWEGLRNCWSTKMMHWWMQMKRWFQVRNPRQNDSMRFDGATFRFSQQHFIRSKFQFILGPIDNVQVAVVQNLNLYSNKDEEPFLPFLPTFTSLVWNLLMNVTPFAKHDALATISIRFLSSLIGKLMHRALFEGEGTLREIFSRIVIPNLTIREVRETSRNDVKFFFLSIMNHDECYCFI